MGLKWPVCIVEERQDGVLVLTVAGRLGSGSAATLDAAVARAVSRGDDRLVIDLTGVDYVSSAGLRALEAAAALCVQRHGALALCGVADPVRVALDLGGLLPELPAERSRDEAIVRVGKRA